MLTVRNIEKSYQGKSLLKQVSFTVKEDETVCLLGPSGSGKSTLLRIIAGLEEAEAGEVLWQDKDLTDTPAHLRGFGLMFQDYALFPHRNVAENIAFGLRMQNRSKSEIEQRVKAALETINMSRFAQRKVTELSGGEQQRVALARALTPEPRLLMFDEPLGALDHSLRERLSRELRRILRETKVPTIYVTHDQEEAFAIADRLLLLHHGAILQSGKPEEFYRRPRNVWVAEFFGLGNLIHGTIASHTPLKVDTPIGVFTASCDRPVPQIGKECVLLFRPNQVHREVADCANRVTGKVIDQIFQGERYRIILEISTSTPLFNIILPEPVAIGESLTVGFRTEDVLCLENGEDTQ